MRVTPLVSTALLTLLIESSASAVTTMDWTAIGHPGNACYTDAQWPGCFGTVGYDYYIGTYEVTNAQYTEFLNAVASSDPNGLYNANMAIGVGGITRIGSEGSYVYSARVGREDRPVNVVSFYDSIRFANWMHNGQPTGAQGTATTEDGAYTITAQGIADNSIVRNPNAIIFLPSEDEWYKAAYYEPLSASYFAYPTGSNMPTNCGFPSGEPNTANCDAPGSNSSDPDVDDLTHVGIFTGAASPYGTFDQGGNVAEWNELVPGLRNEFLDIPIRGLRGGGFTDSVEYLERTFRLVDDPSGEGVVSGFRLAMIPEPGTGLLVIAGMLGLAGWRSVWGSGRNTIQGN